jgi:hypothetical protein
MLLPFLQTIILQASFWVCRQQPRKRHLSIPTTSGRPHLPQLGPLRPAQMPTLPFHAQAASYLVAPSVPSPPRLPTRRSPAPEMSHLQTLSLTPPSLTPPSLLLTTPQAETAASHSQFLTMTMRACRSQARCPKIPRQRRRTRKAMCPCSRQILSGKRKAGFCLKPTLVWPPSRQMLLPCMWTFPSFGMCCAASTSPSTALCRTSACLFALWWSSVGHRQRLCTYKDCAGHL